MPAFPWLYDNILDGEHTADKMRALRAVGVPYTDEDIAGAAKAVKVSVKWTRWWPTYNSWAPH